MRFKVRERLQIASPLGYCCNHALRMLGCTRQALWNAACLVGAVVALRLHLRAAGKNTNFFQNEGIDLILFASAPNMYWGLNWGLASPNSLSHPCATGSQGGRHTYTRGRQGIG